MRYVILGVPEDIGIRANMGRGGADEAWQAFLQFFCNKPSNDFFTGGNALLLGHVILDDLLAESKHLHNENPTDLQRLRELCAEVDVRVYPIIRAIAYAGLEPIVIGGGHNNCFPVIAGVNDGLREAEIIERDGINVVTVSYTHLTLPTN